MKFQIEKNVFLDVLQSAINAVPNKSTIQILNNFALRLEGNFLEVSATDLDLGIRVKVEVQGERDGSVVINARKLLELVKSLVDPSITMVSVDVQDYLAKIQWSEHGKAPKWTTAKRSPSPRLNLRSSPRRRPSPARPTPSASA